MPKLAKMPLPHAICSLESPGHLLYVDLALCCYVAEWRFYLAALTVREATGAAPRQ
jgi:hypothetical protein